jgi:hypothetical protein
MIARNTGRKNSLRRLTVLALFATVGWVVGCRRGGTESSVPVSVSLTPGWPHMLMAVQSLDITATVSNDSGNSGVNWSLSGAGELSNKTARSVTYNAPTHVTRDENPIVTAASIASSSSTAKLQITVLRDGPPD